MNKAPDCVSCKHFPGEAGGWYELLPTRCAAFPDGIPEAILSARASHAGAYPGDQGLHYEPFEGDPRSYRFQDRWGDRYVNGQMDHPAQIPPLQEWLRTHPDDPLKRRQLATLLQTFGRGTEAIAQLRELLRREPEYPVRHQVHEELGRFLAAAGDYAAAAEEYRQAIRRGGASGTLHWCLGCCLQRADRGPEARVEWQRALTVRSEWEQRNWDERMHTEFVGMVRQELALGEAEPPR